ncbi:hypothetical protein M8J76_013485 [Diaphorina citri]|nr:hypothetical protein M8J76_013485 [Diaphorina citri]
MDEPLNAANGSLQKDLIKDEAEPESTVQYGFRSASSQITVAVAQNFLLVALGMSFGMPTVILGALDHKVATNQTRLESPDLIMNDEESSWLGRVSGNMGVLAIFFINALVDWRTTSLISSIIPLLAIVMLLFLPESPTWLISKGRMADAEQSLRWLRGWSKKDKVRVEFDQIVRGIEKSSKDANRNASRNISKIDKIRNELNYFKRPEIIRPFNMLIILFFVTVISAFIPMRPYLVEVFQTFGLPLKSEWVLVLTGVLGITGSLISSLTVNKFGKRPMSLWSTGICFVFTLLLAICAMNLQWPGWIPLTVFCICFWIAGYGILALPWMLMSEIFPIEIRGVACGICAALNSLISFFVTKTYVNTMAWFGLHGTLFLYSFVMGVGFVYMYFYVPETEDRTLQEITDFFSENGSARSFKRPQSIHK